MTNYPDRYIYINNVNQELDLSNPLELAIYNLLKAKEMKCKNISSKLEKITKLVNDARDNLSSWECDT